MFLGHFRLSQGYKYLGLPIVNHVLRSFWGFNQLPPISGSRDMDFGQSRDIWAQFGSIIGFAHLSVWSPSQPLKKTLLGFQNSCCIGVCKNWTITPLPQLVYILVKQPTSLFKQIKVNRGGHFSSINHSLIGFFFSFSLNVFTKYFFSRKRLYLVAI